MIRSAQQADKHSVLEFCKDTFSWGDYIADVWDSWQSKGGLYVSEQDGLVVGVYNVAFFEKEAWLEGMRVRPQYRKKGLGKKMLAHAESVIKNGTIRLIIESENHPSIALVKSMGYALEEKWRLYSMAPEKLESHVITADTPDGLDEFITSTTYADSWKWLPLDKEEVERLVKQKRILVSYQNDRVSAIGIWNRSKDFPAVFQLGFVNGTKEGMSDILRYVQKKAHELGCERIQVFAQEKISLEETSFLEKKSLFYLMKKEL
ncbi:MAG TPA: GNAT family N-acetyltransferase [Candidatus Nitrosotalea sp.]|nr:GNAT family N-acetyltransferase [Candidatus Nitrosotalea sp.]